MSTTVRTETMSLGAGGTAAEMIPSAPLRVCRQIIENVVGVYVFVMLTVFPLFATDMYFDILSDKYFFFWMGTAAMTAVCAVIGLIGLFLDRKECGGAGVQAFFERFRRQGVCRTLRKMTSPADRFLLLFLLVALLSTLSSEWLYEAFWGNMGRYQGLFLWIWYAVAYFMVTRFFRYRRWYLDAALLTGFFLSVWGIQDYLGLDPHGWLAPVEAGQKAMFTSSIGNINTYTSVVGLYLALSCTLFVGEGRGLIFPAENLSAERRKEADESRIFCLGPRGTVLLSSVRVVYYGISVLIFFTALITGQSDNAILSLLAVLCFLPFYAWKDRRGLLRYFLILTELFLSMLLIRRLTLHFANPYIGFWSGILLALCEKPFADKAFGAALFVTLVLLIACLAGAWMCRKDTDSALNPQSFYTKYQQRLEQKLPLIVRLGWLALGVLAFCVCIWLFWDANHGGHPEWYAPYRNVFYFDYDWGTHRGHNWSILMRHFREFPLLKKLIGTGPETYGIVTRVYDYQEMMSLYGEIYDSPHNEFLQYLFTTGILGAISYYGFLLSACVRALYIRRKPFRQCGGPAAVAGVFAAGAYTASSLINISVPIVTPLMLIMLIIGSCANRECGDGEK